MNYLYNPNNFLSSLFLQYGVKQDPTKQPPLYNFFVANQSDLDTFNNYIQSNGYNFFGDLHLTVVSDQDDDTFYTSAYNFTGANCWNVHLRKYRFIQNQSYNITFKTMHNNIKINDAGSCIFNMNFYGYLLNLI